jgi:hypothetical protein
VIGESNFEFRKEPTKTKTKRKGKIWAFSVLHAQQQQAHSFQHGLEEK